MWVRLTRLAVKVVPILDPSTNGIASWRLRVPAATNATNMEVTAELDWMTAVTNMPMQRLAKGLEMEPKNWRRYVPAKRPKPRDMISSERRKA